MTAQEMLDAPYRIQFTVAGCRFSSLWEFGTDLLTEIIDSSSPFPRLHDLL